MNVSRLLASAAGVIACALVHAGGAQAFDLQGSWISDVAVCNKVFVKRGNRTVVARDADLYGSGFVVTGSQFRGKVYTCTIKSRKEDGDVHHILASCSNEVMLENIQFSYKPEHDGKLTRIFPGLPELNTTYYRCPSKP